MADLVEISSGQLSASINPQGAELTSLRDTQGRALMTDADPAFWTGHAPILFPIVGRVNGDVIRVDGVEYPLRQHGFARRSDFALVRHEANLAIFRLTDGSDTDTGYPFHFLLEIDFVIDGATLIVTARIGNTGDVPMPASFGFHPAFAWPLPYGAPRGDHRIIFERDEAGRLKRLTTDGLIAPGDRDTPVEGNTMALHDALFDQGALIWAPIQSQRLTYGAAEGPTLTIDFPDTPMLGIWTKPGAGYVCIEPWHGIADPAGYEGEFRDKPGIFEIAAGEEKVITMRVTLNA